MTASSDLCCFKSLNLIFISIFLLPSLPLPSLRPNIYSIPTLFSKLANPPDPHFPSTFLLTYRMFTNAHEVLDSLIEGHQQEMNKRRRGDVSQGLKSVIQGLKSEGLSQMRCVSGVKYDVSQGLNVRG